MKKYEPVIGLEVHVQLQTNTKCFCSCENVFGGEPNTNVCPVCLGLPGALPVMNKKAVELATKAALAFGCEVHPSSIFARKSYFYPDLPKGYQISQFDKPLATGGAIAIAVNGNRKNIALTRVHLEEDAGKSIHSEIDPVSYIDLNRCGVPLIEIVSEPEIKSPREAHSYLSRLKQILLYLKVSDCNMEEGSLRCDANVSICSGGMERLGTKTEVKNLNSFKAVERALNFEIGRQIKLMEAGKIIVQETLLWDDHLNEARTMRTKEEAHDYRYFPEPDLLPLSIDSKYIDEVRSSLPELPIDKEERFADQFGLPEYDIQVLTATSELADYYEETVKRHNDPKLVSNWIMGDVLAVINEKGIDISEFSVKPKDLAGILDLISEGTISGKLAKIVFDEMIKTKKSASVIVKEKGLVQITDESELQKVIVKVLKENNEEIKKYLAGKEQVFGYFVGEVMKATKGKANPKIVNEILRRTLNGRQ